MAKVLNANIVKNLPWEDRPEGHILPVWRYSKNPIINRNVNASIERTFNSGFVPYGDGFVGVFRGDGYDALYKLYVGRSKDGLHFDIDDKPIEFVDANGNPVASKYSYDPRVVELEGSYYIIFADQFDEVTVGIAKTDDFKTFTKLEYPFPPNCRNGALFPRKINGKYYLLSRPSDNASAFFGNIFISESKDLEYWGHHRLITRNGWANWNNVKCGGGPIPIETDEGWLVIVHGVMYNVNTYVYNMGAIILDKDDPTKVLYKCKNLIMTPQESYEITGHTPNVVFPTNVLVGEDGKLAIYYGAADCYTCLAFSTVDTLIDYIKKHDCQGK
jgi:beta-1,4-mannooligosaccharide/beta-1,4-mannosyl-N-acetylglucosamine phosphorylase